MSSVWGNKIKYTIFGESHGEGIGIVIDGLKSGLKLDIDFIKKEMKRRAPGNNNISTQRKEDDEFQILSGYFNEKTTGTPLCAFIKNKNSNSKDYELTKDLMRPSHADYTGMIKYKGFNDYRGGGSFSGRLTSAIVFAGSIAKQILKQNNIIIGSHIKSISSIDDDCFDFSTLNKDKFYDLVSSDFPVLNLNIKDNMISEILKAKNEMDSVGGIIECAILNLDAGIGDPFFNSVESIISQLLFSIPAVKGVEFGLGFEITKLKGSIANDEMYIENDKVKTYTNNNGGIVGGITNGMPVVFKAAIKPTPSIGKSQRTINIKTKENEVLKIKGRHDPCIVLRAIPVVEAVAAISVLELIS